MTWNEADFRAVFAELIDENPLAVRAVLKILAIEFTSDVPTLAVTLEERPRLRVNLAFLSDHCRTDEHVKAVICHEFLHILLGHTEKFDEVTPGLNLALDTVINAIIHRQLGPAYSSMMSRYYGGQKGVGRLLRPPEAHDFPLLSPDQYAQLVASDNPHLRPEVETMPLSVTDRAWLGLYQGRVVADDILALVKDVTTVFIMLTGGRVLIGDHDGSGLRDVGTQLPKAVREALERAMREMNGHGIWRDGGRERGVGAHAYDAVVSGVESDAVRRWQRKVYEVLKRCLMPDIRPGVREPVEAEYVLPVLNQRDRRAFLRSTWSPLMPNATWATTTDRPRGRANVYLDVSGSMNAEMPQVIALLNRLRSAIRMPFWAFSDEVVPAEIVRGQLHAQTSGGTSITAVLEHIIRTQPAASVIFSDGFIEPVDRQLLARIQTARLRLHAVVTRDGSTEAFQRAGIPFVQLERLPS